MKESHVNLVRLINCYSPAEQQQPTNPPSYAPAATPTAAAAATLHDCANLPLQQLLCGKRGTYALPVKAEIFVEKGYMGTGLAFVPTACAAY